MKHFFLTTLMIVSASLGAAKAYLDDQLNIHLARWTNLLTSAKIDYQKVYASLRGSIVIEQLSLSSSYFFPVHMDQIIFHKAYQFYPAPQDLTLSIHGLSVSISEMPQFWQSSDFLIKSLKQAGYAHFFADITLDAHLRGSHLQTFLIIEASKWGKVELSLELDHVPPWGKWTSPTIIPYLLLNSLKLNYLDRGWINSLLTQLAQHNAMTLENFKQTLIRQSIFYLGKDHQEKLQEFIEHPNTLTLQWQPRPPLALNHLWSTSLTDLKVM